jgi:hypothetical protein
MFPSGNVSGPGYFGNITNTPFPTTAAGNVGVPGAFGNIPALGGGGGTPILAPTSTTGGLGGTDYFGNINNIFKNIFSMFGPATGQPAGGGIVSGGGGTGPFGISPLSTQGNDLTRAWETGQNLQATTAPALLAQGNQLVGGGLGLTNQAVNLLQNPYGYFSALASGNPTVMAQALAPTAANIANIFAGAQNATQGMPFGGQRATTEANLPFAQASMVGNQALTQQLQAEQGLQNLSNQLAAIASGITGVGTGEQSLGAQMLAQNLGEILNKMGINYQFGGPQTFGQIMQGIGAVNPVRVNVCWIAEAIYGVNDLRTHLVRAYLNGPFDRTPLGHFVMQLYQRFGQGVARQVRRHRWLKQMFRPLFDRALRSSIRWMQALYSR